MKRLLPFVLALCAAACAASSTDGATDASGNALSAGLGQARGCAIRDTYLKSDISAFAFPDFTRLPPKVQTLFGAATYTFATFVVPSYGTIVVAEDETPNFQQMFFVTMDAEIVAIASTSGGQLHFQRVVKPGTTGLGSLPVDALTCATEQPPGYGPIVDADAGADGGTDVTPTFDASADGGIDVTPSADASTD